MGKHPAGASETKWIAQQAAAIPSEGQQERNLQHVSAPSSTSESQVAFSVKVLP